MAAAPTNIAAETGSTATMEATIAPSGMHNVHHFEKHVKGNKNNGIKRNWCLCFNTTIFSNAMLFIVCL